MNRHFSWMEKSVTWGGYLKLAGICTAIGAVISGISCVVLMDPAWWQATKSFVRRLFSK